MTAESFHRIEQAYWDKVDLHQGEDHRVEYAADLPADQFGSGFGRKEHPLLDQRSEEYLDHPWNMNNCFKAKNSLVGFK